ncbi:hypothetical protein MMC25_001052 [Agyrium rufum]|nr:hypothetical protein [Agyrium rufum]
MPPGHLRLNQPSESDLQRRKLFTRSEYVPPTPEDVPLPPSDGHTRAPSIDQQIAPLTHRRRTSRLRDSIVSMNNATDGQMREREGAVSPPVMAMTPKIRRFSMLKFRHASDSQLARTAREQAIHAAKANPPPMPSFRPPSIITTAPTSDNLGNTSNVASTSTSRPSQDKRRSIFSLTRHFKLPDPTQPMFKKPSFRSEQRDSMDTQSNGDNPRPSTSGPHPSRVTFDEPDRLRRGVNAPPAYGDLSNSALALPISRLSESERSDGSSGDHRVYATTTTTHTVSTTTTFFRLPRRKKDKGPLFPLPVRNDPPSPRLRTPRASQSGRSSDSPVRTSVSQLDSHGLPLGSPLKNSAPPLSPSSDAAAFGRSNLFRTGSTTSVRSAQSALSRPNRGGPRGRSSTMSSLHGPQEEDPPPPLPNQSTRTSISTGRPSLGGLFHLSRLRHSSEPMLRGYLPPGPGTPASTRSNQNSFSFPREPAVVIPERQEGDTPAKYLARLEEVVSRGAVVALLSKSDDDFMKNVLRSYMRRFKFFEDPMDMAVRKMLMHIELPKETQQIDRTLQSFADRYHECNPGIFATTDEAYFIAFSILILHTDVFNKNNKHKMQKADYTKNTRGQSVAVDVLECFYDNISYTPFIHVEDDVDINGDSIITHKSRKSNFKSSGSSTLRKSGSDLVDPYALILDNNLGSLRPSLEDFLIMQDPFNFKLVEQDQPFNVVDLHRSFFKSGIIQIISTRSRPDAFRNAATITNPLDAPAGVVDMKVTKVGILWRKDTKKKKTRSPWQEWGAILTGSQLYFFRNTSWIKGLISQHDFHGKHGRPGTPVVFKPALEQFKPDFLLSTEDVVALHDSAYKKHKHAFVFVRQSAYEEVLLADNEAELNDWMAKLNYAAAFRTAGVRMRGVIGGSYETLGKQPSPATDSTASNLSLNGSNAAEQARTGRMDDELTQQIMLARRQILGQKIEEAEQRLTNITKTLDLQLRHARHLTILTPVQQKTKEQIIISASRLAASIRWTRMEWWRVRCHRDILALDLAEDLKTSSGTLELDMAASVETHPSHQHKGVFNRLNSKGSGHTRQVSSRGRPGAQPAGGKIFSMDDIFRSPSKLRSHKPQGSWELPPLPFDQQSAPTKERYVLDNGEQAEVVTPPGPMLNREPLHSGVVSDYASIASKLAQPNEKLEEEEHHLLVEAGLVAPDPTSTVRTTSEHDGDNDEIPQDVMAETDGTPADSLSKVRHSLHRKLQGSHHLPSHHRSKRGKDSASSAELGITGSEHSGTGTATTESEGLTRTTGSFTLHGKKASVVTFGSEWQKMSPEEKFKLRKAAQEKEKDGVERSAVPEAVEDVDFEGVTVSSSSPTMEEFAGNYGINLEAFRRGSATSASTEVTFKSLVTDVEQAFGNGVGSVGSQEVAAAAV